MVIATQERFFFEHYGLTNQDLETYLAAALLIYHQAIAGKGHWQIARWLLVALASLQIARITKTLLMKLRRASNPTPPRK